MTDNLNRASTTFFRAITSSKMLQKQLIFIKKNSDAIELRRWSIEHGSVHVAEISLDGALFLWQQGLQKRARYRIMIMVIASQALLIRLAISGKSKRKSNLYG